MCSSVRAQRRVRWGRSQKIHQSKDFINFVQYQYWSIHVRASPKAFLTHHVANISTAVQAADAHTVLNAATSRAQRLSHGFA